MAADAMAGTARESADLVGHGPAERLFLDAWLSGRPHHAWLLSGPRGIGKATLGYRIARFVLGGGGAPSLFGTGPSDLVMATDDPVFRRVAAGSHPGLLTIERGLNPRGGLRAEIVVDDARRVHDFLHLHASDGGWRVVLVDSADELNENAANALLKILEEPPAKALLILICHNPGRLPATIRSRCRRLTLSPLGSGDVVRLLLARRPGLAEAQATMLAGIAEGSIGAALRLVDEGGAELSDELFGLLQPLPRLELGAVHRFCDRLAAPSGEGAYRSVTDLLLPWWLARQVRDLVDRRVDRPALDRWVAVWEKIARLFDRADRVNLDRRMVVLTAFLALQATARAG
ncbi:MAG: DNA polymerase III subunit delta' [Alphaproteobacteria bacterium]|nr:DNA polymerase III subunit delta' [Alphaproteobacteria bacterium]